MRQSGFLVWQNPLPPSGFSLEPNLEPYWRVETIVNTSYDFKSIFHFANLVYVECPKMHLVYQILESIQQIDSDNNYPTNMSEGLQLHNIEEASRSTNTVNYV